MSSVEFSAVMNAILIVIATLLTSINIAPATFASLVVLMVIDFILGIAKAYKTGTPITSYKIRVGIISKMSILILIIAFGITMNSAPVEFDFYIYVRLVIFYIMLSELYSIIGNVIMIKTCKKIPEFEALSTVASLIRKLMERILPANDKL